MPRYEALFHVAKQHFTRILTKWYIQTRVDSWELIHIYDSKEKAVSALEKVNKAMNDGLDSFDL